MRLRVLKDFCKRFSKTEHQVGHALSVLRAEFEPKKTPKTQFGWTDGCGSKPNGYLFGVGKSTPRSSLFKRLFGCSPGYRGFDP